MVKTPNHKFLQLSKHVYYNTDEEDSFIFSHIMRQNTRETRIIDNLEKRQDVREKASIFYNNRSTVADILQAGPVLHCHFVRTCEGHSIE